MKLIEKPIYCDIDKTMVYIRGGDWDETEILDKSDNSIKQRTIHKKHVELLKRYKARGFDIVFWSGNGALWAESVRDALGLQDFVDLCIAKPLRYVDDEEIQTWSGGRIFVEDEE